MKGKLRLLDHFNNMKIGRKIMSAFVMASIVPILTIQFIGYNMNSNSLKRKIDTLMVDNLTQLSERVDLTMDIYSNLVYQIYVDDKLLKMSTPCSTGMGRAGRWPSMPFTTGCSRRRNPSGASGASV